MNRDYIEEIMLLKGRAEFSSWLDFSQRLSQIEAVIRQSYTIDEDVSKELLRYIPTASVACMEAFFRSTIKEMIDFGEPFSDNAAKFNQTRNIKFDFNVVKAIHNKLVSVGEFVSHLLPCNNLDNINSNLSTIIGMDFLAELSAFECKSIYEENVKVSERYREQNDEILKDVKRIFELRHIFCHEFGQTIDVTSEEIGRMFRNVQLFLNHTNLFKYDLLYPNAPETQTDMNVHASEAFMEKDKQLETIYEAIMNEPSIDDITKSLIRESMRKWKDYREAKANADSEFVKGGTIYPVMYYGSLRQITEDKIQSLMADFESYKRMY